MFSRCLVKSCGTVTKTKKFHRVSPRNLCNQSNPYQQAKNTSKRYPVLTPYFKKPCTLGEDVEILGEIEICRLKTKRNIGYSSTVISVEINKSLRLDALQSSIRYIEGCYPILKKHIVYCRYKYFLRYGASFKRYELIEKRGDNSSAEIVKCLNSTPNNGILEMKVLYAPQKCNFIFNIDSSLCDMSSSMLLVKEFFNRYAYLTEKYNHKATKAPNRGSDYDLVNKIRGRQNQPGPMLFDFKMYLHLLRYYQSMRFSSKPRTQQNPTFYECVIDAETSKMLLKKVVKNKVTILSAIIAAILIASKQVLFKKNVIAVDFELIDDFRCLDSEKIPITIVSVLEASSYHRINIDKIEKPLSVWALASMVKESIDKKKMAHPGNVISQSVSLASLKAFCVSNPMIFPPFHFQEVKNLEAMEKVLLTLDVDNIKIAASAPCNACKVIIYPFLDRINITFNYTKECMTLKDVANLSTYAMQLLFSDSHKFE